MADHPVFAALYERMEPRMEAAGLRALRTRLLERAQGRVLEVGGGTGANLDLWPAAVSSVVVCEPDGAMRRRLVARLARRHPGGPRIEVDAGGIPGLPFDDGAFDTIVCTLVLCTVPDLAGGLAELRRLLAPDGRLLMLEHVLVPGLRGRIQRAAAPAWMRLAGGCRLDRDTVGAVRAAGFAMADCERPAVFGRHSAGLIVVGSAVRRETA